MNKKNVNFLKRKATLDDGCNPELVVGAKFDGILQIPIIEKPDRFIIPKQIIPFSERDKDKIGEYTVGFYEKDMKFADILISPEKYADELRRFQALISPDCSLYRDAPLAVHVTNIYRSRAIGHYLQYNGNYVIPQVRWGKELTYTTKYFPEKIAFLGVEKHSIVAIGTYGCIDGKENEYYFQAGLEAMLETLEPEIVIVYGAMPQKVFGNSSKTTKFVQIPDWTTFKHNK